MSSMSAPRPHAPYVGERRLRLRDGALRRYEATRVPRVRRITALARAGAVSRRSNAASRLMPPALNAKLTALSGGPVLRRITRPTITLPA
jgi:hypothetical protein